MISKKLVISAAAFVALLLLNSGVWAQSYPTRPIRLVIPYTPGGVVDTIGRVLAQHLSSELAQPVVAENKPGAGGIVGTDTVARERPDGYTLLLMDPAIVINPTLQKNVHDDLFKLDALSIVSSSPLVLVAAPELNVKTVQALIDFGKANPEGMNFASAGVGTTPHLAGEMLKQRTGVTATHVPYRGIASAYTDLMTNKVQFAFSSIAGALPFTNDNRVVALATTGDTRVSVYPDKPTMEEAGLKDFSVDLWLAMFAPQGLPNDVRIKLRAALDKSLANSELKAAFANVGAMPRGTSPEEAAAIVKSEYEKWKKIITDGDLGEK